MRIYTDANGVYVNAISSTGGKDVEGHLYSINAGAGSNELHFQLGPVPANGVNGMTNEALLAVLIHRTKFLDAKFPCQENQRAIQHMEDALTNLEVRTARRMVRGVEGKEIQ